MNWLTGTWTGTTKIVVTWWLLWSREHSCFDFSDFVMPWPSLTPTLSFSAPTYGLSVYLPVKANFTYYLFLAIIWLSICSCVVLTILNYFVVLRSTNILVHPGWTYRLGRFDCSVHTADIFALLSDETTSESETKIQSGAWTTTWNWVNAVTMGMMMMINILTMFVKTNTHTQ